MEIVKEIKRILINRGYNPVKVNKNKDGYRVSTWYSTSLYNKIKLNKEIETIPGVIKAGDVILNDGLVVYQIDCK